MGLERLVPTAPTTLTEISTRLTTRNLGMIVMVDNNFIAPGKPFPDSWRDARVRTPAGTVSIVRRDSGGAAVVVFGNADPALLATQEHIVAALSAAT